MAIGHLSTKIVQRSAGQTAVHATAYATRTRIIDERTGTIYDYSRNVGDVMFSFVGLPKDAPEGLRDAAAFANALEGRETRKNSQTARKFIMALPHELTPQQREWLVKDFGRENFIRKGLAYHVAIHKAHDYGDHRNVHAHWTVSTRVMEKGVFTDKHRESNTKDTLRAWRDNWEKMVNRHLERHGHATRISMKTLEAQGIDRTPQIHLGQGACALERKGQTTELGAALRSIANDNGKKQPLEFKVAETSESYDRDESDSQWQDRVNQAGINTAEARHLALVKAQAAERQEWESRGKTMVAAQGNAWNAVLERYHDTGYTYQSGTIEQGAEAATGAFSFILSLFTNFAERIVQSATGRGGASSRSKRSQQNREEEETRVRRQQHQEALDALQAEQAAERAAFERRREEMMKRQQLARGQFEEPQQKQWGELKTSFDHEAKIQAAVAEEAWRVEARQRITSGKEQSWRRGLDIE